MKKQIFILTVILFLFECNLQNSDKKAKLTQLFDQFQTNLQTELKNEIKKNGVVGAVLKCKDVSPDLESSTSLKNNITIKRVSEKPRNLTHTPDEWELTVLKNWEKSLAEGKKPEIFFMNTKDGFRGMKPILIENGLCLQCHGTSNEISKEVAESIQNHYPKDLATGYKMNDLRGGISGIIK